MEMVDVEVRMTDEEYTTSRLKKWFKTQFQGYEVVAAKEVPKVTPLGRLTYECRWYLRHPE